MHIYIERDTVALPTADLQKTELQVFNKCASCLGNYKTGNFERVWRNVSEIVRRFSAQEHDTDTTVPICALLWDLSFTKYICVYLCTV